MAFAFNLNAQIVNIPDANFKNALISLGVDTNGDGEIQVSEAESVISLDLSYKNISDLSGIQSFTNLQTLACWYNQITNLDISGLTNITTLLCRYNQLSNLNVSNLTNLEILDCSNNQLTSLDVSNLTNLLRLDCFNNQLSSLDLTTLINLEELICYFNPLVTLDIYNLTNLTLLSCSDNQLTSLDVSTLVNLTTLYCANNQLTSLDVSSCTTLDWLHCFNNQLSYLNIKNGSIEDGESFKLQFQDNPNLEFICADEDQIEDVQLLIDQYGYTNTCQVSTYCSFTPGGEFYTINGNTVFDLDTNGCDASDINYPNLLLQITDGATDGAFYSNELGDYTMPIQAGNYAITPQFENPSYFSMSPSTVSVNFPSDPSPYTQDFCITPNGVHDDLEVFIVPLEAARPGFDTDYKIIYKNKGNTTLSGSIDFTFDDDYMDLLTLNPTADSQSTGSLIWNYSNLLPFETREINFTMTLNTPTDADFPLNDGDFLDFSATINPVGTDEIPDDNTANLNQEVVNSYDPNDKTCLEGQVVTPDQVGKYVHYLVRFENTGTANAVNIVVKDVIDTSKYDLFSLVPLDASHDFYTRIRNGNEVEFIFENIQLPFDDANNNGYVLFKIQTLPGLVVGDSFSNEAEIYFDYNAPIITNNETTTVQENLGVNEFLIADLTLFPNPTGNYFEIRTDLGLEVETVELYDISGKILKEFSTTKSYNISNFNSGIYFLKIKTNKGEVNKKIIKQ